MKALGVLVLASALFVGSPASAWAQPLGSGSCETLAATNAAAFAQLCKTPREFPEFGDQVQGDGDSPVEVECGSTVLRLLPGQRVLVAGC